MDANLAGESHPGGRPSKTRVLRRQNQFTATSQDFEDPTTSSQGTGNSMQDEVNTAGLVIYADELGSTDEANNLRKSGVYAGSEGIVNEHSMSITNGSPTSEALRSVTTSCCNLPAESHPARRSRTPHLQRLNQFRINSQEFKDQTRFSEGDFMQDEVNTAGTGDIMQDEVNPAGSDVYADELRSTIQGKNLTKLRVDRGPEGIVDKPSISITNGSPISQAMGAYAAPRDKTGGLTMRSAATIQREKTANRRSKNRGLKFVSSLLHMGSARRISPTEDSPSTSKEVSENSTMGSAITIGGKTHRPTKRSSANIHGDKTANHVSKASVAHGIGESSSSVRRSGIPDQCPTSLSSAFEELVNMEQKVPNRNNRSSESASMEQDDLSADDSVACAITGLTSDSKATQMEAALELRFLARDCPENRVKIAEADGIRPLIELISSDDPEVQEQSVTAILNLSLNDENKSHIADLNGIKPLTEALKVGKAYTKANAACALLYLSKIEKNNISIGCSGAIPLLVSLLEHGNLRAKRDALAALFSLCSIEDNRKKAVDAGIVKPLVGLMVDLQSDMLIKSARVLTLLLPLADARKALKEQGALQVLVKILKVGGKEQKEIAVTILLQLCDSEFGRGYGHLVANEGARPLLEELMKFGTSLAKQKVRVFLFSEGEK